MLKRWKHKGNPLLIEEHHEPGIQRGFMEGKGSLKRAAAAARDAKAKKR
jgi:hypothetical protein